MKSSIVTVLLTLGVIGAASVFPTSGYAIPPGMIGVPSGEPAPEMSVMMLPIALGAAGYLAIRSRRKAMKKKKDPQA
jgi:hypothetical protein